MDEVDLFDRADIELQHKGVSSTHLYMPEIGVVTGIRAGSQSVFDDQNGEFRNHDHGFASPSGEENNPMKATGIMTTVRIEQSYV